MPFPKTISCGAALAGVLLLVGCGSARAGAVLQWPVSPPPAVSAAQPRVWVALGARLGASAQAAPLELRSARGSLSLTDASGQRWNSTAFTLRWIPKSLPRPLVVERLVAGPFASFETAERQADRWRALGVPVTLAQPGEWELWAPLGSPLPSGLPARPLIRTHHQAVVPVLVLPGRPLLPLQGTVRLEAPGGLRWQGGIYRGPFRLQGDAEGAWTLVEQVPLERYLEGVVPHEIGAASPAPALAAQAVLARTWAVRNQHRYAADGYHLCATVQCQVYSDPAQASPSVRAAIERTRDQVLSWQGQAIHAVYHATNGGVAAPLEQAWDAAALPYLRAGLDRAGQPLAGLPQLGADSLAALLGRRQGYLGADHPRFRWTRSLSREAIAQRLARVGLGVGQVQDLSVLARGSSGRVLALQISGSAGTRVLRLDAIRRTLRNLPSTLFVLRREGPGRWQLQGGGFGHGVGLSQAGAIELGRRGWAYERILERYYPGTRLQTLGQLSGSQPGDKP